MVVRNRLAGKILVATALLLLAGTAAQAQKLEIVFKDTLWGAGIGAVVGTAQATLDEEPDKEVHRIWQGAAIGAIVGLIYGVFDASGAFALNETHPAESALARYDAAAGRWRLGPPPVWVRGEGRERLVQTRLLTVRF